MLRSIVKTVVNYGSGVIATALLAGAGLAFGGPDTTAPASSSGTVAEKSGVSPEALARAQEKVLRAQAIVNEFASRAILEGFTTDQWRYELMSNLLQGGSDGFVNAARAGTLLEALKAAQISMSTARGSGAHGFAKSLGSTTGDLIFFPSPPCRIVDTRTVGGAFAASEARTYSFTGGVSQVNPSPCDPYGDYPGAAFPAAMAINVGAIAYGLGGSPSVSGFVSVYPQGGAAATSFLNFWGNDIISNAGVVPLNQANGQFTVLAQFPTHITVDYFGSFVQSPRTALDCTSVYNASTTTVPVGSFTSLSDASIVACPSGYKTTSYVFTYTSGIGSVSHWFNDPDGAGLGLAHAPYSPVAGNTDMTITVGRRCCRIPGR